MSSGSGGKAHNGGSLPEPHGNAGVTNASDGALRADVERFEALALWAARLLLLGLVLEIVLAALPPADKNVARWSEVFATAIVALGVWGEVRFAKRASIRQSELLRRSEYQLKIALLRTERRSVEDGRLITALEKFSAGSLEIRYPSNDQETHALAEDFEMSFSANGWKVCWYVDSYSSIVPGIILGPSDVANWNAVEAIRSALTEAKIEFSTGPIPMGFQMTGPFGAPPGGPERARLYIGPKPHVPG